MYIKVSLIHDIQVLIYRGSTNERLSGEGVAYDSYYSETDRVRKHVQACRLCQEHNKHVVKFSKMNFEAEPAPVRFISMDLIGEFTHPPPRGIGML